MTDAPAAAADGLHRVYVHGTAVHRSWADPTASLTDLIFATTRTALDRAGLPLRDIGSVVLGAHDVTDGRSLSSMVTAPAAGAYLKDEIRLGEDGASAFVLGAAQVRAGATRACIVAAWGRASEGDPDAVAAALFDPFFTRPLGLTEIAVSALRAGAALARYPGYREWRAPAAARRPVPAPARARRSAAPLPLRSEDLPVWSDVVAVAVLSAEPGPVEVRGVGMSTEPYQVGDRDLLGLPALAQASSQALRMAGCGIGAAGVLELDGLTLFDEALALEAVGAAAAGGGMRMLAEDVAVNADGGYVAGYCPPAMGLVRICAAADRLTGLVRPAGAGPVALATGSTVVAAQAQAAVVLAYPGDGPPGRMTEGGG
jgi:acetyl-CoA C-acetyltransferase